MEPSPNTTAHPVRTRVRVRVRSKHRRTYLFGPSSITRKDLIVGLILFLAAVAVAGLFLYGVLLSPSESSRDQSVPIPPQVDSNVKF